MSTVGVLIALTETAGPGSEMLAAALVAVVALGLAWIGGRRLPIGVGEGLFVAGLSGLLVLNYAAVLKTAREFLLAVILVSLAVVWFVVAVWVEKEAVQAGGPETAQRRAVRCDLAVHAAAVAGLLAIAVTLFASEPDAVLTLGMVVLLGLLLAVAVGLHVWRRGVLSRYGVVGLLVVLLWLAVPRPVLAAGRIRIGLTLLLCGALSLIVVLVTVLWDWRLRVRAWRADPARLIEPPPKHRLVYGVVVALCAAVGVVGVLPAKSIVTPLAVLLAAYACHVVGHRRRSNPVGELGMMLVAESIIIAAPAWLPRSPADALLGMALAGAYLLWLARFWHQQLNDGKPWTTTGRLIPVARHLSYAAAGGQLALAAMWALRLEQAPVPADWQAVVALLLVLLHGSMLVRDAVTQRAATPALAAGLVLLAALVPAHAVAARFTDVLTPAVWLAAAGIALALRVGSASKGGAAGWVYNVYIGGLLPMAAAYDLALRGPWETNPVALVLAPFCWILAIWLRWGRDRGRPGLSAASGVL